MVSNQALAGGLGGASLGARTRTRRRRPANLTAAAPQSVGSPGSPPPGLFKQSRKDGGVPGGGGWLASRKEPAAASAARVAAACGPPRVRMRRAVWSVGRVPPLGVL